MKTKSLFSSLGVFTAVALLAVSSASAKLRKFHFIYSGASFANTAVADGVMTIDDAVLANPGSNNNDSGSGAIVDVTMTVSGAVDGNGTFTTADFSSYFLSYIDAINLNTEWVGQPQPTTTSTWGLAGSFGQAGDLNFFAASPGAPNGSFYFLLITGGGDPMTLTSVTPYDDYVIFTKGDAVPGVADAKFTGFGTPSVNEHGAVALLGKWKSPAGSGAGIFVNNTLVAKAGDDLSGGSATQVLKSLKDPVIDDTGHVAFAATLQGSGVTPLNDSALVSNAGGFPAVVAQEGSVAPETGGVYKSFSSVALPGGAQGPLWLATLDKIGPITSANNQVLLSTDPSGNQHVVLQSGTTEIGGKIVKSFKVLKAVSGTPGQTHAFNGAWHVVSQVTFSDGSQATVSTILAGSTVLEG